MAIVDGLVAAEFPAISVGHEHGTIVGALINLSLILALMFCPGGAQDDSSSRYDELFRTPDPPPPSPVAAPPLPPPTARAANAGFGRRGL